MRLGLTTGAGSALVVVLLSLTALPAEKRYLIPMAVFCSLSLMGQHVMLMMTAVDRGSGQFAAFNRIRTIAAAAFPVLLLAAAWLVQVDLFVTCLAFVLASVVSMWACVATVPRLLSGPSTAPVKRFLWEGRPYAFSMCVTDLLERLDLLLVLWLAPLVQQGFYAAMVPVAYPLTVIPNTLGLFLFNAGARSDRQLTTGDVHRIMASSLAVQAVTTAGFLLLVGPVVRFLYTDAFAPAIVYAMWLAPMQAAKGITQGLEAYLKGRGRPLAAVPPRLFAAVVLAVVTAALFPRYGAISIAVAALAAQIVLLIWSTCIVYADVARSNRAMPAREPMQASSVETPVDPRQAKQAHVVLLVNFLAPNDLAVCREIASRVGRLTILSSVAVESNRQWAPEWGELDVVVQKTWTFTRQLEHPGGFRQVNYIHVPRDTFRQLRRLRPDAVVSLELGMRTLLSAVYRRWNRRCAHVVAVRASERSEAGRGKIRNLLRRNLLRIADRVTYNGPSCHRLLVGLGTDPARLSLWQYASDPRKHDGEGGDRSGDRRRLQLLTIGELSDRKGVLPALRQLADWCNRNPERTIDWHLVGSGPLEEAMKQELLPEQLRVHFHGFCDAEQIPGHYRDCHAMLFPTLADEWGLVVDEALASGVPVIGSCHAQACQTLIREGDNGFAFDPEQESQLATALDRLTSMSDRDFGRMSDQCRESVADRTPAKSAEQFVEAVSLAMASREPAPR